jgi:Tfp pilus assembly protein PilF
MLAVVRELSQVAPDYPQVHYLQAVLAARAGDPVLARSLLTRSGLAEKGVPAAMMLEAIVSMQQGSFDTAATTLEALADRQPGNMRVKELLARAWWLGGRPRAVVDRFGAEAEGPLASPYLVMLVGRCLERMGERERAIAFIERARQARPAGSLVLSGENSLPEPTNRLRAMVASRDYGAAGGEAAGLLRRFPQSGDIHALAGDVALAAGQPLRAIELYGVSAKVRRSWPLTRKLIAATRRIGEDEAADAILSRYLAGDPQNPDALVLLAERSAERQDWLRVAVVLDTAMRLGAGSDLEVLRLRAAAARALGDREGAARFEALLAELAPRDFL